MILWFVIVVILLLIFCFWLSGFLFGAPFQTSSDKSIKNMIKLSRVKKGEKVADLGSGNGKLVIEFAKRGAFVTGFEINPLLVWISRRRIRKLGLQNKAKIKQANFWNANLSRFDVICVFQIGYIMGNLEKKLKKELKRKKRVRLVSNTWKFPDKKPVRKEGHVFLYKF